MWRLFKVIQLEPVPSSWRLTFRQPGFLRCTLGPWVFVTQVSCAVQGDCVFLKLEIFVTFVTGGDIYLLCQMGPRHGPESSMSTQSDKTELRTPETHPPSPHSSNGHPPTSTVALCQPVSFPLIGCWLTECHHGSLLHVTVQREREKKNKVTTIWKSRYTCTQRKREYGCWQLARDAEPPLWCLLKGVRSLGASHRQAGLHSGFASVPL